MNVSLYLHIQSSVYEVSKNILKKAMTNQPSQLLSVCLSYPSICPSVLSACLVCLSVLSVCMSVCLSCLSCLKEYYRVYIGNKPIHWQAQIFQCSARNVTSLYKDSSWPFIMMISTHKCVRNILMHSSDLIRHSVHWGSLGILERPKKIYRLNNKLVFTEFVNKYINSNHAYDNHIYIKWSVTINRCIFAH